MPIPVNVATPDALVDCVNVPLRDPVVGLSDKDTSTPADATGLLFASSNCTEMLGNVEPDATVAGTVVVIDSTEPVPDPTLNAAVLAGVSTTELTVALAVST